MSYKDADFQDVSAVTISIQKDEWVNKPLVGKYAGSSETQGKFGMQMIHSIQEEDGKSVSFYGFTLLDRALAKLPADGTMIVKITYLGLSPKPVQTKFGMKQIHEVRVQSAPVPDDSSQPDPKVDAELGF